MEYNERSHNPFKIIVFILLGGALIILTDLFILDKKHTIFNRFGERYSAESIIISNLRGQHSSYMDTGIDIEVDMLSMMQIMPPPPIMDKDIEIVHINVSYPDEQDNVADATLLASITPAVGVESGAQYIERYFKRMPLTEMSHYEEVKSVSDVISDLNISKVQVEKDLPVILSVDVANIDMTELPTADLIKHEYSAPEGNGLVVIIIDDMGISLRSRQVEVLPGPLTLSYLPYAKNLNDRTKRALQNGHELMLHMPMEPMNGQLDGGPNVLKVGQGEEAFLKTFEWGLSSFDGFVGVNNHMGSRLTKDSLSMQRVMRYLKNKDLFFIDSKTIGSSVAASTARETGIPYAERDVFLDHEINTEFINNALEKLEHKARSQGYAIAIGHPHKETIAALKAWLPTLQEKGLTLVPASRVIKHPIAVNGDIAAVRE
ncbi:MAG: hypothetical protein COA45_02620 [Zetaproteobacteria bacterium]|nr:MAG: hypothetical protein COA45_02620 [Zetaproteobacteria bacterium]